jgi:hypothetical protein
MEIPDDLEARIATLAGELAGLRAGIASAERTRQHLAGERRVYEAATLALVASHPQPHLLGPVLEDHLTRVEAGVVALSGLEAHLEGVHAAQKSLRHALSQAVERTHGQSNSDTVIGPVV